MHLKFKFKAQLSQSLSQDLRQLARQLDMIVDNADWNGALQSPEGSKCWQDLQTLQSSLFQLQQAQK